jgi:hypothetical protein
MSIFPPKSRHFFSYLISSVAEDLGGRPTGLRSPVKGFG